MISDAILVLIANIIICPLALVIIIKSIKELKNTKKRKYKIQNWLTLVITIIALVWSLCILGTTFS